MILLYHVREKNRIPSSDSTTPGDDFRENSCGILRDSENALNGLKPLFFFLSGTVDEAGGSNGTSINISSPLFGVPCCTLWNVRPSPRRSKKSSNWSMIVAAIVVKTTIAQRPRTREAPREKCSVDPSVHSIVVFTVRKYGKLDWFSAAKIESNPRLPYAPTWCHVYMHI